MCKESQVCTDKVKQGLLTELHEEFTSQLYNIGNVIGSIEVSVFKLRDFKEAEECEKVCKAEQVPMDMYERYRDISNQLQVLYNRLNKISQNLGNIV